MPEASPRPGLTLDMPRLGRQHGLRKEAYAPLKRAICSMDIYDHAQETGSTSGSSRRGSG